MGPRHDQQGQRGGCCCGRQGRQSGCSCWRASTVGRLVGGCPRAAARLPSLLRVPPPRPRARSDSHLLPRLQVWLVKLEGVESPEEAALLRGHSLLIPASARQALEDEDEFYVQVGWGQGGNLFMDGDLCMGQRAGWGTVDGQVSERRCVMGNWGRQPRHLSRARVPPRTRGLPSMLPRRNRPTFNSL